MAANNQGCFRTTESSFHGLGKKASRNDLLRTILQVPATKHPEKNIWNILGFFSPLLNNFRDTFCFSLSYVMSALQLDIWRFWWVASKVRKNFLHSWNFHCVKIVHFVIKARYTSIFSDLNLKQVRVKDRSQWQKIKSSNTRDGV